MKVKINSKITDISIEPVKRYTIPKYPTKTEADRTPELLRKLPPRWQKNAAVVTAVGLFGAMTLTSCGIPAPGSAVHGITENSQEYITDNTFYTGGIAGDVIMEITSEQDYDNQHEITETTENIYEKSFFDTSYDTLPLAPGGLGPPVYMSEADIYAIIAGMTKTYGLNFEKILPDNVSERLYDAEKQVGVEYTSRSSKSTYISSEGIAVGIFDSNTPHDEYYIMWDEFGQKIGEIAFDENSDEYDAKYDEAYAEYEIKMQALVEKDLRGQVQDFIEWLQGQGII